MLSGKERVIRALSFEETDRIPRYLGFSEGFKEAWREARGWGSHQELLEHFGSDMVTLSANETPWPSRRKVVRKNGKETVERDAWGSLILHRTDARFNRLLEPALPTRLDPESLRFDDPLADERYARTAAAVERQRNGKFVVCKTGGPYIRATFMRGTENLLLDMAEDPAWVQAFVERLTDHLIAVGVESLRRFRLQETGIIVHDDVCSMRGPIMGPRLYEKLILPSLARMIAAYKEAGAARYIQHCDGDVRPLLDMWVEAGVDVVNPCELRAGFDPFRIRKLYGRRLGIIGCLDNTRILPRGEREEVVDHIRFLQEAGREGGLVICAGISEDVSVETMELVKDLLDGG